MADVRIKRVSRDLKRMLDHLDRGEISEGWLRSLDLEEQLTDARSMIQQLRGENKVLKQMLVARKEREASE